MRYRHQKGTSTVEFALVALVVLMMMFGVFEIGRGYYTYAMLDEVTRRGARLASVCPINDPAIARLSIFGAAADPTSSGFIAGLTTANLTIDYLDAGNAIVAAPTEPDNFMRIRYARARVVNFVFRVNLPFITGLTNITMPAFEYILPRESLGVPREGAITPC